MAKPLLVRLMRRVEVTDHCWLWHAGSDRGTRYNLIFVEDGKSRIAAKRAMWRIIDGEPPPGWRVYRMCGNNKCVRPMHLYIRHKESDSFLMLPADTVYAFEKRVRSSLPSHRETSDGPPADKHP